MRGYRQNIQGGSKPSVKAPDPMIVTRDEYEHVERMTNDQIRDELRGRVPPTTLMDLITDRATAGGRWRIAQELFR